MSRSSEIRARTLMKFVKFFVVVFLIIIVPLYFFGDKELNKSYIQSLAISFPILFVAVNRGTKRLIKSYETLEITLSDQGIERTGQLLSYKMIKWADLRIEEKPNGAINLYDKSVSTFNRKMYGKGWIQIQPETIDIHLLLSQLQTKVL
jgi:hypothetical protein